MKRLFYIIPLLFVFGSCEQDANVDLPEVDPVLVLNCIITPQDSFVRVTVAKSEPIFGAASNNSGNVDNATVTLYGNSSSIQLPYNSMYDWYEVPASSFPIIAGNEYHLVVSEPGGLHADAYTTVPLNAPVFTCTATTSVLPNTYEGEVRFSVAVNDEADVINYYRFISYNMNYRSWNGDSLLEHTSWHLFNDDGEDGTTINESTTVWYYNNSSDSVLAYHVYLLNCNYDYYRFHQSLYNYHGEDPFSEPVLIYSNITDGLGIFAAANASWVRVPR